MLRFLLALGAVVFLPFAAAAQDSEPVQLLAFGDSLVHGYGLPTPDNFPSQLEAALEAEDYKVDVVNAGNSGDTTAAGLARLEWAMAETPDAAIVVLGANDALRGLDPARTFENLDIILTRFEELGVPVLLAGMMAPRNLGADYAEEFDGVFPRLAEQHDVVFYPFFLEGVATDPDLNQSDGIHPNGEGVAEIVEGILPKVKELLSRAEAAGA